MERTGRLIGKSKIPAGSLTPEELACAAWAPAVGKKIAAHAAAVTLVRGCLTVEVEDNIWQRQLNTLRPQIIRRIQEISGPELVQDIAFRPMIPRRMPQRAETVRSDFELRADDADSIMDPVMRRVYKTSRKKASA
jgi:hypothetical protein